MKKKVPKLQPIALAAAGAAGELAAEVIQLRAQLAASQAECERKTKALEHIRTATENTGTSLTSLSAYREIVRRLSLSALAPSPAASPPTPDAKGGR